MADAYEVAYVGEKKMDSIQFYLAMLKQRDTTYNRNDKPWWRARTKRYWDKQPGYGRKNVVKLLEVEARRLA